jgi:hypothetical protein
MSCQKFGVVGMPSAVSKAANLLSGSVHTKETLLLVATTAMRESGVPPGAFTSTELLVKGWRIELPPSCPTPLVWLQDVLPEAQTPPTIWSTPVKVLKSRAADPFESPRLPGAVPNVSYVPS